MAKPMRRHSLSLYNKNISISVYSKSSDSHKKTRIASSLKSQILQWFDKSWHLPAGEQLERLYEKIIKELHFIRTDPQINLPDLSIKVSIAGTRGPNGKLIRYIEIY